MIRRIAFIHTVAMLVDRFRPRFQAALPDALLLHRAFPGARRITARLAATRRDRLSAPLPMLRAPHPDGGPGAVRVEVWGRRDGASEVTIYGTMGSPADIAATVAATATVWKWTSTVSRTSPPYPHAIVTATGSPAARQ